MLATGNEEVMYNTVARALLYCASTRYYNLVVVVVATTTTRY